MATKVKEKKIENFLIKQYRCRSSNGTSVNGILMGKNKERSLEHNGLITIAKAKVYVFMVGQLP